jgi:tetratricopeptide (TPR) repeat protein
MMTRAAVLRLSAPMFAVGLLVFVTWNVHAADCANPRKSGGSMSESVYKAVQGASELISKQKSAEAIDKLAKLVDSGNDYEKAVVSYNLGFAYSSRNDLPNAAKSFARALELNSLPQSQHDQLQFNLGQLYIVAGRFGEGIATLQAYIAESCTPPSAEAHLFLANALSQNKQYAEARAQIDQALAKAKEPKESWLQLKLAINYEMKDFKACAQSLVQLIGLVPHKPEYWKQLSAMFMELKQDTEAVAVLALAERQGFIAKPNEIKNLYSVYMMLDLPFKAGLLVQEAIEQRKLPADETYLEAVANAWINARETARAEATLKKLASMADRGDYHYKLGAMYGDEERWSDSKSALEKALQKGGLKRTGEAWMRLAVAHYSLKDNRAAIAALQKAINYDESRKQAAEWLRHLSNSAGVGAS